MWARLLPRLVLQSVSEILETASRRGRPSSCTNLSLSMGRCWAGHHMAASVESVEALLPRLSCLHADFCVAVVVGYGLGPLLFAPLSEIAAIGRNWVYVPTFFLFVILSIPTALVSNYAGPVSYTHLTLPTQRIV